MKDQPDIKSVTNFTLGKGQGRRIFLVEFRGVICDKRQWTGERSNYRYLVPYIVLKSGHNIKKKYRRQGWPHNRVTRSLLFLRTNVFISLVSRYLFSISLLWNSESNKFYDAIRVLRSKKKCPKTFYWKFDYQTESCRPLEFKKGF